MSAIVALQHEYAHAFTAAKFGFRMQRVVLMPYGAVISGDFDGISPLDEFKVAISGPLCNLCTAVFFVALWWIFPDAYAFTDVACFASLTVFAVNLLPAYPLDGGRALFCLLKHLFSRRGIAYNDAVKRARRICKATSFSVSGLLLTTFIALQVFGAQNFTLLFFSAFVAVGAFEFHGDNAYERLPFSIYSDLKKGAEIRSVALDSSVPAKRAAAFLERGKYLVLEIYENGEKVGILSQERFLQELERQPYNAQIGAFLSKN